MSAVQPDGATLRDHLKNAARIAPSAAARLVGPEIPREAEHVWLWFSELSNKRAWADGFPQPISDSELVVWCRINGRKLKLWEYKAIGRLDVAFRNYIITKKSKEEDNE